MSSTRKPPEHLRPAYNLPEAAAAAEAAAVAEAAEAEAAEVAAAAEAAAAAAGAVEAVEAAVAVCRGELAAGARLWHFPITLTDAGRHDRVDEVRPDLRGTAERMANLI
jgi:hypothetical protein